MHTASQVRLLSAVTVRPKSLCEDVHASTGHPGYTGMQWHQKNTIGANYTDKDAASARGICQGCALGSAHQYPTNQHYVKSDTPYDPGQQFVVDACTHHSIGAGGFVYAHLFTDLASQHVYPLFIKSKLVVELTEMMSKLFFAHPEWKPNGTTIDRKIKVDMETGYQSEDFKEYCHSLGYRIEISPTRDKHAHDIAERSVGNIVTKASIAMMGNINNPCPQTYWPEAIQYACHCDGFGYKSKIGTSPYFYLTQRHVHLKYLHPFSTPVYYTIPPHQRHGDKLGQARALKGYFVGYSYSKYLQPCYRVDAKYANRTYGRVCITKDVIFDMSINFRFELESNLPTEAEFNSISSLELVADEDNADALRRQLILAPTIQEEPVPDIPPAPVIPPDPDHTIHHEDDIGIIPDIDPDPYLPEELDKYNDIGNKFDIDGIIQYWYNLALNDRTKIKQGQIDQAEFSFCVLEKKNWDFIKRLCSMMIKEPRITKSYEEAMTIPEWRKDIETGLKNVGHTSALSWPSTTVSTLS